MSEEYSDTVAFIRKLYGKPEAFIPLHEPRFYGNDRAYVMDAIDSTFVSSVGRYVDQFEEDLKTYTGAAHAVAIVNGTAALHIALIIAGVKRDELVITQPLSFIATCNAISYIGAEPVFVDIDRSTLGLSPNSLAAFLEKEAEIKNGSCYHKGTGKRIAACVPMHTLGHPAEIDTLVEVCNYWNIPLIEDAAESIGSTYKGKQTGTFGLLGTFSFNGNKTITSGGGGAIVTNDEKLAKLAKHLTTQAKVPHQWEFVHDMVAYNYRMPNLNAALACAQLERLDTFIAEKRKIAASYSSFFADKDLQFFVEPLDAKSNYWLNAIIMDSKEERNAFLTYTNANKVMTRPVWELMNRLPMFLGSINGNLENAEYIADRLVNIPSSSPEE